MNMKTTHYGHTVDSETPITGVVQTADLPYLIDEIDLHGIDLYFEEHCKECTKEFHEDCYNLDAETTHLLGYKKDAKGEYIPDLDAEFSAIVNGNENTTQVTHSKWVSRAALCSPCYPGQGDMDTPGDYLIYTLPPDMWNDRGHLEINKLDETLESIKKLYTAFYNTDRSTLSFAGEFFYMVGDLISGKKLSELHPIGDAAETLKELLKGE